MGWTSVPDAAFLDAIRSAPDDDLPRLTFADRLDEQGRPLAEFIRAQCDRARRVPLPALRDHVRRWQEWNFIDCGLFAMLRHPQPPGARDHLRRLEAVRDRELGKIAAPPGLGDVERALLERHEPSWAGPLPGHLYDWAGRRIYRRGFVEHAELTSDEWLRHGADVLRHCPVVQSLTVNGIRGRLPALAGDPGLAQVRELHLDDRHPGHNGPERWWHAWHANRGIGDSDWAALLGWPHRHKALFLRTGDVGREVDAWLRALAASPALGQVAALDLVWDDIQGHREEARRHREGEVNGILGKPVCHVLMWDLG
jgi:uncharacterized protein (TIGR02996 family)